MTSPEEFLLVGRVSAVFGVQGQIKVRAFTDQPDHLRRHIRTMYLGDAHRAYSLSKVFEHKPGLLIMTLGGVTTRDAAEELIGSELFIRESEAAPLKQDEYYLHELYGLQVFTEDGGELGTVREVLETGANEVLVVARHGQSDAPSSYDSRCRAGN